MHLPIRRRTFIAVALLLTSASVAWASSAGFAIRVEGIDLGKADESKEPPQFRVTLQQGQTISLIAQGMAYPRGGAPSPTEPEAGAWLFDDAVFRLQPPTKKHDDKTVIPIRLIAEKVGIARVRFVGIVLGYEKRYDLIVEVIATKK
ncbi:MAG TPA: hypothetical protein VEL76_09995 [Gemmataceae bacterium]|nr:hypothetical protein [Gemmataceae bacterium]